MKCDEIRERMPDMAAGYSQPTGDEGEHLESCGDCAQELKAMRETMTLLDEWQAPEPSAYFDTRLQARLREEMAKPQAGWLHWFRRPVLAAALTVAMGVAVGWFFTQRTATGHHTQQASVTAPAGTAVSDLQTLDNNHEMYADFDLLDDLELQQNVAANP
jgi:hypothetical protein